MSVAIHYDAADLALFAMQILQPEQHQAVTEHLVECAFCRQELARLQGDLAAFAHTVEMRLPAPAIRDRVLHQAAREKKNPPPEPRPTLVLPVAPAAKPHDSRQNELVETRDISSADGRGNSSSRSQTGGRREVLDEDHQVTPSGEWQPTHDAQSLLHRADAPEELAQSQRELVDEEQESRFWRVTDQEEEEGRVHDVREETRRSFQQKEEMQLPARSSRTRLPKEPSLAPSQVDQRENRPQTSRDEDDSDAPRLRSHRNIRSNPSSEGGELASRSSGGLANRFFLWLGWAAAICLAVAGGKLYYEREGLRTRIMGQTGEVDRLKSEDASSRRLLDTITDPSTRLVLLSSSLETSAEPGPQGRILYAASKGALIFLGNGLAPLEAAKSYELWLVPADGRDPIPAGVFHPDAKGNANVILPPLPRGTEAKAFGITIEEEDGAQAPTLPIILAGS